MTSGEGAEPTRSPFGVSAGLDLEDLLSEIRLRARGATESQERLAALLDAVVAVSSDLDLSVVLTHIVESACTLLRARYGALGVLDRSGRDLAEFVHHGMPEGAVRRIAHLPQGRGVLGLLLEEPRAQRVADLTRHPSAVGFPPGHPPMASFIGVPIRVRDVIFGNLYLTEKIDAPEFTQDDEDVLVALAAAAGIAIENAQLYRRSRRAQEWSEAVGDLTRTLLEGRNERSALARMVKRARDVGDALVCALLVPDPEGGLTVQAVDTAGTASALRGEVLRDHRWQQIISSRTPMLLRVEPDDPAADDLSGQLREPLGVERTGTTAVVPITVGEVEVGLLVLGWGRESPADIDDVLDLLTGFADRMGLAIEAGRAQRQRSRSTLLEDRDRIARDMHDHVIQRLYAAGLTLQAVSRHTQEPVTQRVDSVVDELDRAVKDIRSAIFELHHGFPEGGLGPELEAVLERATTAFGFVPDVSFEGRLADLPAQVVPDVVAVVREALSNIAKHAQATDAAVTVVRGEDLVVTVTDNGVGLSQEVRRSGLANLADRAARHGGTFEARPASPSGTVLVWRIPLETTGSEPAGSATS